MKNSISENNNLHRLPKTQRTETTLVSRGYSTLRNAVAYLAKANPYLINQLEIQKSLSKVGVPVQELLRYNNHLDQGHQIVRAEFRPIAAQIQPKLHSVEGCLDTMISAFETLKIIHDQNVFHGNPSANNWMFQLSSNPRSNPPNLKAHLADFSHCGYIDGNKYQMAKDVQIVLSEFGGKLLLTAESQNYEKLRILQTHLTPLINFADQDDLDVMLSASETLEHLRGVKTLLSVLPMDYSFDNAAYVNIKWGPLCSERVLRTQKNAQEKNQ